MARYNDILELEPKLAGCGLRVGIVMSRFNPEIGEGLLSACADELKHLGVAASDMAIASVPVALRARSMFDGIRSGR